MVVARAAQHGAQQLQQVMLGRAGAVKHRLAGAGWGANWFGFGPAPTHFGVSHHHFQVQLGRRPLRAHDGQQVQVVVLPVGRARGVLQGGLRSAGAVELAQPAQQLGLRVQLSLRLNAGHGGEAFGLHLLWRGRRGTGDVGASLAAQQLQALVRRLEHERHTMFALLADVALAVTLPVGHLALGRQGEFNRQLIGRAPGALHLAQHQPVTLEGLDVNAQHLLAAVQHEAPAPGPGVSQGLQRLGVKPQAGTQGCVKGQIRLQPLSGKRKQL